MSVKAHVLFSRRLDAGLAARRRSGVSALELITVLLVIGVLTSTVLLGYRHSLRKETLLTETQKIHKLFSLARSYAIGRDDYFQVTVSFPAGAYWLDQTDALAVVTKPKIVHPEAFNPQVVITAVQIGSTIHTTGTLAIRFYPDGTSDNAMVHLVRSVDDRSDASLYNTIKVYGPTARANIFERQRL